jgi:hypothetical protein
MAMLNYQRVLRKAMDLSNDTWRLHVQDTAPSVPQTRPRKLAPARGPQECVRHLFFGVPPTF